jgi:hypothetical protein
MLAERDRTWHAAELIRFSPAAALTRCRFGAIDRGGEMYARAVRFTDVSPERIDQVVARVAESEGPPPGVDSTGMKLFVDESQGTAIFIAFFDTEQAMSNADAVFKQMDAGETPGTRASIDQCEVKIERSAGD